MMPIVRRVRWPGRWSAGLFVVVVIGRLAFSLDRRIFHIVPDEAATAAMARHLAGGTRWDMFINSVWRPGPATAYAPAFLMFDDPVWRFRTMLVLAALFGAVAAVVLLSLLRRLAPRASEVERAIAAGIAALAPPALLASAHIWAEPLVTLTVLVTALGLVKLTERPTVGAGLIALGAAAVGAVSHGRLLPLVVVACGAATFTYWRGGRRLAAVLSAAFLPVCLLVTGWYVRWFVDALWQDPGPGNDVGSVAERLAKPGAVLLSAIGQSWYLAVSTLGLAVVGVGLVARRAGGSPDPARTAARVVLVVTAPLAALSVVFMAARPQSEHLVYGRYNDAVVWPYLAVGTIWLLARVRDRPTRTHLLRSLGPLPFVAVAIAAASVVLLAVRRNELDAPPGLVEMVGGLIPFGASRAALSIAAVTLIAVAAIGVLTLLSFLDRRVTAAVLVTALLWGGWATHRTTSDRLNLLEYAAVIDEIEPLVPVGTTIGFLFVPDGASSTPYVTQLYWVHAYQWYLDDFSLVPGFDLDAINAEYVLAPDNAPALIDSRASTLWRDPYTFIALWWLPE